MKELHTNPDFIFKAPIFLDCSCNGIQHLAAILQDLELGTKVNLASYDIKASPNDIYSETIEPINKAINSYGKDPNNKEFSSLSLVKLNRKIIKHIFMTKVYNISLIGISSYLRSKLEHFSKVTEIIDSDLKNNLKKTQDFFICPGKDGIPVNLTYRDVYKIATIINEQIFVLYPSLNKIYDYLLEITKLIINIGIPLT